MLTSDKESDWSLLWNEKQFEEFVVQCVLADYLESSLQPWSTNCSISAGRGRSCRSIELEIRDATRNYLYEFRKDCTVSNPSRCDWVRFEQVWLARLSSSVHFARASQFEPSQEDRFSSSSRTMTPHTQNYSRWPRVPFSLSAAS